MFIATLFTIALFIIAGDNPNVQQQVNGKAKLWYTHAMEYYSAMKGNKELIHAKLWTIVKIFMLSERRQTKIHTI